MKNQKPLDHSPDLFQECLAQPAYTNAYCLPPLVSFFFMLAGCFSIVSDKQKWRLAVRSFGSWWAYSFSLLQNMLSIGGFTTPPENASERHQDITYKIHGIHHDYPKDKRRLAMPPWLSVIVATLLLMLFRVVFSFQGFVFTAGFLVGYALYLIMHYSVHAFPPPRNRFVSCGRITLSTTMPMKKCISD
jgi:sterol desaturase/sphingolipid hydroxylase (fatty acid hydroxylase superfamily)